MYVVMDSAKNKHNFVDGAFVDNFSFVNKQFWVFYKQKLVYKLKRLFGKK